VRRAVLTKKMLRSPRRLESKDDLRLIAAFDSFFRYLYFWRNGPELGTQFHVSWWTERSLDAQGRLGTQS
jgi:hypothetical protein